MLELLHEIPSPPDTVLAAITAALITLFGIHLQNRSNFRQLQERLDQERVERSTQRKIELRRETYLKAEKDLVDMQVFLGQMPTLFRQGEFSTESLNNFTASAGQVQLISEIETAKVAGELATQLGEAYLEGLRQLIPFIQLSNELAETEEHLNVARTESKRLILEITTWHEKAEQNHDEYNRLNHSFEFWNRKSQEHLLKKANLEASRIKLELQHSEWLVEKLKMAHQVTTELRSSLRQELEFEEGKEKFGQLAAKNSDRIIAKLKEFNKALEKEISDSGNTQS